MEKDLAGGVMYNLFFGDTIPNLWWDMCHRPGRWVSRLVFLLGPWFTFVAVELLNQNHLIEDFELWQLFFNMVWYYLIFIAWRMVLGRLRRAAVCAAVSCFAFGLVNHYVLRFRGRILFPADISGWRTAANVLGGLDLSVDLWIKRALIVMTAYLFLVAVCRPQRRRAPLSLACRLTAGICVAGYLMLFFCTGMLPALNIYTQQWNTQNNGFLFNFSIALRYSRVDQPEGYSHQAVEELVTRFPAQSADPDITRPVNLIVVMNEAFADMTVYEGLEPSEDPTPFLHSLREDTVQGWLFPPVTGGGTASTEYEFLTGLSNSFLPPHCVAYQLYVKEAVPALSQWVGAQGYRTVAFHPYRASGWNRPIVYDYMKFSDQLFEEDVTGADYVRRYISDRSSYEKVFSLTEQADGAPVFIFNVTMQNHSGYAQGWKNLPKHDFLSAELNGTDPDAKQYLSLMRESDDALRMLIEHYERVEQPTMVVFFGDHQPSLKKEFLDAISAVEEGEELTVQQTLQRYAVPFFIWTNYDIPEQKDLLLSSNFLGALVTRTAGLPQSGWLNFLSQLSQRLPVVTPVGYVTEDGQAVEDVADLTEEQRQWLLWYEQLAYCGLRDMTEQVKEFFRAQ